MSLSISPIDPISRPFFGGVASGIDITKPLTKDQAAEIENGMDEFGVLVFYDQRFTDEAQMAFSRNFGELELATNNLRDSKDQRLGAHIADISNLDSQNNVLVLHVIDNA
jgi:alpha-ketoglutarate-dependent 2,4-dichlorophenoxyacetate dioxygenase